MSLTPPNLDDRTFDELVKEAVDRVNQTCPAWTDFSTGDPGRVLLELFAHLTETMIYRLNQLPEKAYREFLNLMGVRLYPPAAARAILEFTRSGTGQEQADQKQIPIPAGTRVAAGRSEGGGEAPVFITADDVTLPAGQEPVRVAAYHCEWVEGELVGRGTGLAGLTVQLSRPPVIAPTGDPPDLVVGVEAEPCEPGLKLEYGGKPYRIWREVPSFTGYGRHECVYVADRHSGQIAFAPEARITAAAERELTPAIAELRSVLERLGDYPEVLRHIPDKWADVESRVKRLPAPEDPETMREAADRASAAFEELEDAVSRITAFAELRSLLNELGDDLEALKLIPGKWAGLESRVQKLPDPDDPELQEAVTRACKEIQIQVQELGDVPDTILKSADRASAELKKLEDAVSRIPAVAELRAVLKALKDGLDDLKLIPDKWAGLESRVQKLPDPDDPELQEAVTRARKAIQKEVEALAALGDVPDTILKSADRASAELKKLEDAVSRITATPKLEDQPRALAQIPPAGREIRAWYRRGGGPDGNVAAGALTVLRDPIPGLEVEVTNPARAVGGREAESLENARVRGPQEMHCQERAVTARDFEALAKRASGEVARVRAVTQAKLWKHGQPGTVEVLLVPDVPAKEWGPEGQVTAKKIEEKRNAKRNETVREQIQDYLDARRPLGVRCVVKWAQLKPVSVHAKLVVHPEASKEAVKKHVGERLYRLINPLGTPDGESGWDFGRPLYASLAYREALADPRVLRVDDVKLKVESAPKRGVTALAADHHQEKTWYVASRGRLFRSQDDGDGWEPLRQFENDIVLVRAHPHRWQKGLVAAVARDGEDYRVHVSRDCGEAWEEPAVEMPPGCRVYGMDWTMREKEPWLLLATDKGLYELALTGGGRSRPVEVDLENGGLGFYAVAVAYDDAGSEQGVAVAARKNAGVYLRRKGGKFVQIGLKGEDIRVLAVNQDENGCTFLWAGRYAEGPDDKEAGCWRRDLLVSRKSPIEEDTGKKPAEKESADKEPADNKSTAEKGTDKEPAAGPVAPGTVQEKSHWTLPFLGSKDQADQESTDQEPVAAWETPGSNWRGGSCRALAFGNGKAYAATHHAGVLCLDLADGKDTTEGTAEHGMWQIPQVWLAWRTDTLEREIVRSLATSGKTVLAGTDQGVLRSQDGGVEYQKASAQEFTDRVTLPSTWLFCSGKHEITVKVMGEQDESK